MANLSVSYLGLNLSTPVIISSSPLTASADKIAILAEHGAGAVVMKSIFEEQIEGASATHERYGDYSREVGEHLFTRPENDHLDNYLEVIAESKKRAPIPIIASINCSTAGAWIEYARGIQEAGADALELNIFLLPTDANVFAGQIEANYLNIVGRVVEAVNIPVSVKLGMRFTNILSVARQIYYRHGRGVVMYNRFFEPDIDIDAMTLSVSDSLSSPSELRNALRMVALCRAEQPDLDISVSTGIHDGQDAVKAILAGASSVQICSAIYQYGLKSISRINDFIAVWMERNDFGSIDDFRGKMNYRGVDNPDIYQRVQYMRYLPR